MLVGKSSLSLASQHLIALRQFQDAHRDSCHKEWYIMPHLEKWLGLVSQGIDGSEQIKP